MTVELMSAHCPTCRRERPAEVPPCSEGHGDLCPDRACIECGTALLVDAPLFGAPARDRRAA